MTSTVRLYALVLAVLVFFLTWATVAARPWVAESGPATGDPQVAALAMREDQLRERRAEVQGVIDRRWAEYERDLAQRQQEIADAEQAYDVELRKAREEQKRLDRKAARAQAPAPPPQVEIIELPPITQSASS